MDIERLNELKLAVGVVFQHWLDTAANQKGFDNTESKKFFEHDAEHIQEILDEAIARQSVKSEEVAEAIEQIESLIKAIGNDTHWRSDKLMESLDLAITALQAYQPTTRKDRTVEEVAISKTETTSEPNEFEEVE